MKVVALEDRQCGVCRGTIEKGEECLACMVQPDDPLKKEFEIMYLCKKCRRL